VSLKCQLFIEGICVVLFLLRNLPNKPKTQKKTTNKTKVLTKYKQQLRAHAAFTKSRFKKFAEKKNFPKQRIQMKKNVKIN